MEDVHKELHNRFDVYVEMNEAPAVAPKGVSMATSYLCGCVATYVDNPNNHAFSHDSQSRLHVELAQFLKEQVTSESKVHFIVPGQFYKVGGELQLLPDQLLISDLNEPIRRFQEEGISVFLYPYERINSDYVNRCSYTKEKYNFGEGRYKGTAWLDGNGELFVAGRPAQESLGRGIKFTDPYDLDYKHIRADQRRAAERAEESLRQPRRILTLEL